MRTDGAICNSTSSKTTFRVRVVMPKAKKSILEGRVKKFMREWGKLVETVERRVAPSQTPTEVSLARSVMHLNWPKAWNRFKKSQWPSGTKKSIERSQREAKEKSSKLPGARGKMNWPYHARLYVASDKLSQGRQLEFSRPITRKKHCYPRITPVTTIFCTYRATLRARCEIRDLIVQFNLLLSNSLSILYLLFQFHLVDSPPPFQSLLRWLPRPQNLDFWQQPVGSPRAILVWAWQRQNGSSLERWHHLP